MLGIFHDIVQNALAQQDRRRTNVRSISNGILNPSKLGIDGITRQQIPQSNWIGTDNDNSKARVL
jgi:hypothetical protein